MPPDNQVSSIQNRASCPSYQRIMARLCKTNPIPSSPEPPQPLMSQRLTPSFRSSPPPKNKPNQTQFITAKPAWGGPKPDPGPLLRSPRYASRFTRYDPFRFTHAVSAAS